MCNQHGRTLYKMIEQRHSEFKLVEEKATGILENQEEPPLVETGMFIIALMNCPSFENWNSWYIWSNQTSSLLAIRHILWNRVFDQQRFFNPLDGLRYGWSTEPSIKIEIFPVEAQRFMKIIDIIAQLTFHSFDLSVAILDGDQWSIRMPKHFGDNTIKWNSGTKHEIAISGKELYELLANFRRFDLRTSKK